jgi:outer membrane immunogenic protein
MTSNWIKAGAAAVALLVTPLAAGAADIPMRPPVYKGPLRPVYSFYNWTGFYVGIVGGYGWGTSNWSSPALTISPKGGMIGATVGYNWQAGSFVYGLEADFSWSMMKGDTPCGIATCETKNTWFGTARGRLGYSFDRFLPYVTAGAAFGNVEAVNNNPGFGTASDTRFGWTAGAGLEYAFLGNWTAKVEYLYVDLGSFDCGTACTLTPPANVDFKTHLFRVGVNYKFGGPVFSRF